MPATASRSRSRRGGHDPLAHPERLREAPRHPLAEAGQRAARARSPSTRTSSARGRSRTARSTRTAGGRCPRSRRARGSSRRRTRAPRSSAIFESPAHTPVKGVSRTSAAMPSSASAATIAPSIVCTKSATRSTRHDRIGHELAGAVVGHAAAAVGVAHLDALGPVPVLAHGQVAGLGAPPLRVDGRVLEHEQQVRDLAGLAPLAERLLERHALPVRDRAELRHPEFSHGPKATLRPSGSRRALLARPHPLAAAWRVDVAHLHRRHAARRPDPPSAPAGRRRAST